MYLTSQFANSVQNQINNLLANGVMSTSIVVSGILLSCDQLLRVEQLSVGSGTDLINNGGLEIEEDGTGDVLASSGLREEGVERVITTSDGLVRGHLAIRLDTVLKAVQLPASITNLYSGLSKMDRDTLTLRRGGLDHNNSNTYYILKPVV